MRDFKKEVEEVLRLARDARAPAAPSAAPAAPLPAQGSPSPSAAIDRVRLEGLLEEMKSRVALLTRSVEEERRARERDAVRLEDLRKEITLHREAAPAAAAETAAAKARAAELEETLKVTAQAHRHALTALEESKLQLESWSTQARLFKERLDSVEPTLAGKEAELRQAQERYEASLRDRAEETRRHQAEALRLADEAQKAKAHEAEVMIRLEQQRRGLDQEREHLLARTSEATEAAEHMRREAEAALKAARELELRLGPARAELNAVLEEEKRKISAQFDADRAKLYKELDEERARQRRELAEERSQLKTEQERPSPLPVPPPALPAAPPASLPAALPAAPPAPARSRGPRIAALALAALLSWTGAFFLLSKPKLVRHSVPFSNPSALVWSGNELWAADWKQEAIYRLRLEDGVLKVKKRYALAGAHITGMAVAGEALYLTDSWKREIQLWRVGVGLTPEKIWPSPGENPGALYWDGTYLWSADSPGRIFQHAPDEDLTVLNTYPADFRVAAIHSAPEGIWTADSDRRVVIRHLRDSTLSPIEVLGADFLDNGTGPLSAFARRGGRVWLGRERSSEILELPESRLSKVGRR